MKKGETKKECRARVTKEYLQENYEYDDGFLWRKRDNKQLSILDGNGKYYVGCILGLNWQMHRAIWIYHNGAIPEGMTIDHIDRDGFNNKIENLRLADASIQNKNRSFSHLRTGEGIKYCREVTRQNGTISYYMSYKPSAYVDPKRKMIVFGTFDTPEEARHISDLIRVDRLEEAKELSEHYKAIKESKRVYKTDKKKRERSNKRRKERRQCEEYREKERQYALNRRREGKIVHKDNKLEIRKAKSKERFDAILNEI